MKVKLYVCVCALLPVFCAISSPETAALLSRRLSRTVCFVHVLPLPIYKYRVTVTGRDVNRGCRLLPAALLFYEQE